MLANALAGMSLFLTGISGIRTNLQQVTGHKFRKVFAHLRDQPLMSAVWGFASGAVTQSSTAIVFILSSLISAGGLGVAEALPLLGWSNLGTTLIVFVATMDTQQAVFLLLGITGLALFINPSTRFRHILATLFSIGMLFLGLAMIKEAVRPLPEQAWFSDAARILGRSVFAAFLFGALLRMMIQSSSAVAIVLIALSHSKLFAEGQTLMAMFGTGVGAAVAILIFSSKLRGLPRQIILYQAIITAFAGCLMGALFYVETWSGWTGILHGIRSLPVSQDQKFAFAFLALQGVSAATSLLLCRGAPKWLARLSPPTAEQDIRIPRHLQPQALDDHEAALQLVTLEQNRLIRLLPNYLPSERAQADAGPGLSLRELHEAVAEVSKDIQHYLTEMVDRDLGRDASQRLLQLETRQRLLSGVEDSLYQFGDSHRDLPEGQARNFADSMVESLDLLIMTGVEAIAGHDPDDLEMLASMTRDRGEMMERLRAGYMDGSGGAMNHQERANLLYLTSLFERCVWLLHQWSKERLA